MKYAIEFYYKSPDRHRPDDACCHEPPIESDDGHFAPIPNVGDTVSLTCGGQPINRKVLTRHFIYSPGHCCVSIVVTDVGKAERERG